MRFFILLEGDILARMTDEAYMQRALELALQAEGNTSPNPMVGCVIVDAEGNIVGEGYHHKAGEPHAEVNALAEAKQMAQGATAYVTLEPCAHYGRTGPCCVALARAGIGKVVVACLDPNPKVAGQGLEYLRLQGIEVVTGVCEKEAKRLNERFFTWITKQRPFITLKYAELTTRLVRGKNPVRVVLDSSLKISLMAAVLNPLADTIIFTGLDSDIVKAEALAALPNVEVVRLPLADGVLPVAQVVQALAERGIASLLVEGGSAIHGAFFDAGLADRVCAFVAPKLIGGAAALPPVGGAGSSLVETGWQLTEVEMEKLGSDVLITGLVPELDKQELPKEAE